MFLPRLAVSRPVAVIMTLTALMIIGAVAFARLPVDLFPRMNFPVAIILTGLPGAAPEDVEAFLTRPVEEAVATVAGLRRLSSDTREGMSLVVADFSWGVNMDFTALEIREKLDRARGSFPSGADTPVVIRTDPSLLPVMTLALSGGEDPEVLRRLATTHLKPALERVEGVAVVDVHGGHVPQVEVLPDPGLLTRHGLTLDQLIDAIRAHSASFPAGAVVDGDHRLPVRVLGGFSSPDDIGRLRLPVPGPERLTVGDVAEIVLTHRDPDAASLVDGAAAVALSVRKNADANTVAVSRRVRDVFESLQADLHGDFQLIAVSDQAEFIEDAIGGLIRDGAIGALLATGVLMAFIRSLRSVLVVAVAIPAAVITCFAGMYVVGMTLNIMSLAGLAISIGILLDNSIIVLESIHRRREMGEDGPRAAVNGASDVMAPVAAATLTTVCVFLPVIFVTGLASHLFRDLALTVSFTVAASLLTAFTIIPLWAARVRTRAPVERRHSRLTRAYGRALDLILRQRGLTAALSLAVLAGGVMLLGLAGAEFLPPFDHGEVAVDIAMERGTRLEVTLDHALLVKETLSSLSGIEGSFLQVGSGRGLTGGPGPQGSEAARLVLRLSPGREESAARAAARIAAALEPADGVEYRVRAAEGFAGMEYMTGSAVEIVFSGPDLEVLQDLSSRAADLVWGLDRVDEVTGSGSRPRPQLTVSLIDARPGGVSAMGLAGSLSLAIDGTVAARVDACGHDVDVVVRLAPEYRDGAEAIGGLPLMSPGGMGRLADVAETALGLGPSAIGRRDQARAVSLGVSSHDRDLQRLQSDIERALSGLDLPPGYSITFEGEYRDMVESLRSMGGALVLAVALVYMVLAGQFESLLKPLVIMVAVPLSLAGALGALVLAGMTINLVSIIGTVMLAGVAVNDSIILMDFADRERRAGASVGDALRAAGTARLRPIIMTTVTTALALLPVALGWGPGAAAYAPFGIVLVAGLWMSTLVTLLVLPALYWMVDDVVNLRRRS